MSQSFVEFLSRVSRGSGSSLMIVREGSPARVAGAVLSRLGKTTFLDPDSLSDLEIEAFLEKHSVEAGFVVVCISRKAPPGLMRQLDFYLKENRFRWSGQGGSVIAAPHPGFRLAVVADPEALKFFPEFFQKTDFKFRGTVSVISKDAVSGSGLTPL